MAEKESESGKWLGRRPKGEQDTDSFRAFLKGRNCGCRGGIQEHLRKHHRGFNPRAEG